MMHFMAGGNVHAVVPFELAAHQSIYLKPLASFQLISVVRLLYSYCLACSRFADEKLAH